LKEIRELVLGKLFLIIVVRYIPEFGLRRAVELGTVGFIVALSGNLNQDRAVIINEQELSYQVLHDALSLV
jgi:hypothetical protein